MGLLWLTVLATGMVIALAPPQTIGVRVRVCAIISLASFGLGTQVAQAGTVGGSPASQVGFSTISVLLALAIPVSLAVARRVRRA